MTLPADGEYWPPTRWSTSLAALARYDAWYTDDLEALQYLYATTNLQQATSVWSQVRRFFWGSPTPQTTTERPVKMHVPVAATIARLGAQVLFSELPGVQFGDGDHDQDDQGLTGPQGKLLRNDSLNSSTMTPTPPSSKLTNTGTLTVACSSRSPGIVTLLTGHSLT